MLADLVKAGTLPAVDERLPKNPYVITAPEVGKHGGIWHRGFLGPSDRNGLIRIVNDGLVRFSIDGASVEMKYAESVEPERRLHRVDHQAARGRQVVRWRAVHRGRHHVLL